MMEMVTINTIDSVSMSESAIVERSPQSHPRRTWIRHVRQRIAWWWLMRSTRINLADLDDGLLRDIGITPEEANSELKKSLYLFNF